MSFKIAERVTKLDAANALAYAVAREVAERAGASAYRRRRVSELKRFSTQVEWEVINDGMQILGGIG